VSILDTPKMVGLGPVDFSSKNILVLLFSSD